MNEEKMTIKETVDAVANTPLEDIFQIILIGCLASSPCGRCAEASGKAISGGGRP